MLRRTFYWRCAAAILVVIFIIIYFASNKKLSDIPIYNYASLKIGGYDFQTTKGATVNVAPVKTPIETIMNTNSNDLDKADITLKETSNMVELIPKEIDQMVSLSTERLLENYTTLETGSTTEELPPLDETVLLPSTLEKLREKLRCYDKSFESKVTQRGEFWVYINYIRAEHGPIACHENITLTTHGDFTFLDHLDPLIKSWNGPLSVAIHTPGDDLAPALDSMRYMRDCSKAGLLIKKWVTFHIFFHKDHFPKVVPHIDDLLSTLYNCSLPEPYIVNASTTYSAQKSVFYYVNVGRNVAMEAALTHFIFPLDIELYPSPYLGSRFLNMIARDPPELAGTNPRVFVLAVFEIQKDQQVPLKKNDLLAMLKAGKAINFHQNVCAPCHRVPGIEEWVKTNDTQQLDVFTVGKRSGLQVSWEPFFIGTQALPLFDERLTWQGKSNKMTQNYIMCVEDYDYMVLNDAFLVHHPGVKIYNLDATRKLESDKTNALLAGPVQVEYNIVYGTRSGCEL